MITAQNNKEALRVLLPDGAKPCVPLEERPDVGQPCALLASTHNADVHRKKVGLFGCLDSKGAPTKSVCEGNEMQLVEIRVHLAATLYFCPGGSSVDCTVK